MNGPEMPTPREQAAASCLNYEPFPLPPLRLVKGLYTDGTVAERLVGSLAEARLAVGRMRTRRSEAAQLLADTDGELEALKQREQQAALELDAYVTRLAGEL